jgi:hypothetical protein
LNGCSNSCGFSHRFDVETAFLAPAVVGWVTSLRNKLKIDLDGLRGLFITEATKAWQQDMPVAPEAAWLQLNEALLTRKLFTYLH